MAKATEEDKTVAERGRRAAARAWRPCPHEGPILERRDGCTAERRHVRECAVFKRCTRGPFSAAVPNCESCKLYPHRGTPCIIDDGTHAPPPEPAGLLPPAGWPEPPADRLTFDDGITRHLLYHVYPLAGNGTWQRCVDRLSAALPLFNGRRLMAIVTGGRRSGLDPPEAVRERVGGFEFLVVPNNRRLREVASFVDLWSRLAEFARPGHVAFYGHAKGVTHPVDPGVSVHAWTDLIHETAFDYWPLARDVLRRYPVAGSFVKQGRFFACGDSLWHYSGGMYWARLSDVFARNWRNVDRCWWGTEAWPGNMFPPHRAGRLFYQAHDFDLYQKPFFDQTIIPEYERWKSEHASSRFVISSSPALLPAS